MHNDSPMSFRSLLRRNRMTLSTEDSWVLAGIAALQQTYAHRRQHLASDLLDLLTVHPVLGLFKRAALVQAIGGTNRLMVISSANRFDIPNAMTEGYSCYISKNGSLLSCHPGIVRFFSEASRVVERFWAQNLPPQRSIYRIANIHEQEDSIQFKVSTISASSPIISPPHQLALHEVALDARSLGVKIEFQKNSDFMLSISKDIASIDTNVDYSVEVGH